MDKWISIASQYGLAGLILLFLGLFIYYRAWPALERIISQAQEAREKELTRFESHLEKKDLLIERIVDKQNGALDSMAKSFTGEFGSLRDEVRSAIKAKKEG